MRYKYYVTDAVRKWWNKQHLGDEYVKALARLEKSTSPTKLEDTLPFNVQLTRLTGKSGRPTFVWMSRKKDDATVYVLRTAFGHDEYEDKLMGTQKVQEWAIKNELTEEEELEVEQVLDDMINGKPEGVEAKPLLSGEERDFLSGQLSINQDLFKDAIYETKAWVDYVQGDDLKEFDFYAIANEIENHIYKNIDSEDGWQQFFFEENVIFLYHKGENWILDGIYPIDTTESELETLMHNPEPTDFRRGYPFSYLSDKDQWRYMELEKKSNMVLSEDQVKIVSQTIEYPLFITGRAGSGKSTILQYLFAEMILRYVYHKSTDDLSPLLPPVYLSYSENLIQDAKKLSQLLLEKNRCYKDLTKSLGVTFEKNVKPEFDGMFFVFEDLVKNCIRKYDVEYLNSHFTTQNYISFAKFNSKWHLKFGNSREANKKYGPSLSWHVIRTYIKGWDSTKLMSPADYAKLPEDRKTVSDESFALVYDKVWDKWYSKLENTWDDQDIVRYCLDMNYVDERFSGIFCDEAQDFTRVELDFILKLSCFANRTIEDINDVKKLPFVFAGDEFQTLNPTGFSWESLSSYFAERLCALSGLPAQGMHLADAKELSENFRSTQQVVKLANHIQLLRATRFNSDSVPQSPHFSQEGSPIVCLSPSDRAVFDKLRSMEVVLIVPAADGVEVGDYIQNSPLKDMIDLVEGSPVGLTVLNPTQAKGLEYPNVAIYGFESTGTYANLSLKALKKWYANPENNSEADIELKYQLSNAYVAVTRASNKLFIIDKFDTSSFWSFCFAHPEHNATITQLNDSMMNSLTQKKREQWTKESIGWINQGTEDDITAENVDYMKLEENRMALEKRAEALRDSGLMRQAAVRNKEAGRIQDEDRCWAKVYVFEEQYLNAGDRFVKAAMPVEAVTNYWLAIEEMLTVNKTLEQDGIEIVTKIARLHDKAKHVKSHACVTFRQNKVQIREFKMLLDEIMSYLSDNDTNEEPTVWNYLLNKISDNVVASKKTKQEVYVVIQLCSSLANEGISINPLQLGYIAYNATLTNAAVTMWKNVDEEDRPDEYFIEIAKLITYPERISYLMNTRLSDREKRVLEEYRHHAQEPMDFMSKMTVAVLLFNDIKTHPFNISPKEKKEMRALWPALLCHATDQDLYNQYKQTVKNFCDVRIDNENILDLFNQIRYGSLENVTELAKTEFVDKKTQKLVDALIFINKVKTTDYVKSMLGKNESTKEKINTLRRSMRFYANQVFTPLVVMEVAKVIEARGFYKESILYYETMQDMSEDHEYLGMIDVQILCISDKYAEITKDKQLKARALELRKKLNLEETDISDWREDGVDISGTLMLSLYEEVLRINGEVKKKAINADESKAALISEEYEDTEAPTKDNAEDDVTEENKELVGSKLTDSDPVADDEPTDEDEVAAEETTDDTVETIDESPAEEKEETTEEVVVAEPEIETATATEDATTIVRTGNDTNDISPNTVVEKIAVTGYAKPDPSASTQKIDLFGYQITWIPKKSELNIQYTEEDDSYSLRVSKGKFRGIGFERNDNDVVMFEDSDKATPFIIHIENSSIVLEVFDLDKPTGMRLVFETND